MSSFTEKDVANIYKSHASIIEYIVDRGKNSEVSLKQLADHWRGCAGLIERELEKDDPSV